MKKLSFAAISLIMMFLVSCGSSTIKLDQPDTVSVLKEQVFKAVSPDARIVSINLMPPNDYLSTEVYMMTIEYLSDDDKVRNAIVYLGAGIDTKDEEKKSQPRDMAGYMKEKGRSIKDYDFSMIFENVSNAAKQVIDSGAKYSGVGSYKVEFAADPGKDKHSFCIRSGAGTSVSGRNLVTEYYEHDAKAGSDGVVTVEIVEVDE